MAIYRHIYCSVWRDPKVLELMDSHDRLYWIYILSNTNVTQIGVYTLTKSQMCFELGFSMDTLNNIMDKFINKYDLIVYNESTYEICIKRWGRYNLNKLGKPMLDCIKSELKDVKDKSLLEHIKKYIEKEEIITLFDKAILDDKGTSRVQKENKTKIKENKKENKNTTSGGKLIENCFSKSSRSKYTNTYEGQDEKIYDELPTKEDLQRASEL